MNTILDAMILVLLVALIAALEVHACRRSVEEAQRRQADKLPRRKHEWQASRLRHCMRWNGDEYHKHIVSGYEVKSWKN